MEPSALREVATEISDVRWDDVGGLDEVKRLLTEVVLWQLRYDALFQRAGVRAPKGVASAWWPGAGSAGDFSPRRSPQETKPISLRSRARSS